VSGRVGRGRLFVGTCASRSCKCRDVFVEMGLNSGRVRRSRISVGTCPGGRLKSGRDRRGLVSLGTFSAK